MFDMDETYKRIFEKEENKIEVTDDGSIRALVLNGNYREIGDEVFLPYNTEERKVWLYASINDYEFRELYEEIEYAYGWKDIEEMAKDVVTVCRRKLKKEDIIICSLSESYAPRMTGFVFTEKKIYSFDYGKLEYIIEYDEIDEVDFNETEVILKLIEGEEVHLYCEGRESYTERSKHMYNLIMDIKERLEAV